MDDFHTITKARVEEELRAALEIVQEVGLRTEVFVPPQWKLGNGCKAFLLVSNDISLLHDVAVDIQSDKSVL
jgi:predicted deacetylase